MSTIDLPASSYDYDDFFDFTLPTLAADVDFDLPVVSPRTVESIFGDFGLHSPIASSVSTVSSLASSTNSSSAVSSSADSVSLKAKRYRSRKREERKSLRNHVKTLEVRLAALKTRSSQTTSSSSQPHCELLWEAVAMQESERRQPAERENEELRESVALHRQLAQKLDQMMQKVVAHANTSSHCWTKVATQSQLKEGDATWVDALYTNHEIHRGAAV